MYLFHVLFYTKIKFNKTPDRLHAKHNNHSQEMIKVPQSISTKSEHRLDARVTIKCPVFIHGITESGERIKIQTITDNLSQSGLFLQMPQALKLGSAVFVFAQLLTGARLAARGRVIRVENKEHGLSGSALCFSQTRLIPAPKK